MSIKTPAMSLLLLLSCTFPALAERADRDKPINVEAARLSIDDNRHVQTLEGDVVLTQGTLQIHADKIVITEDRQGFQKSVATGGPKGKAHFRQKREGRNDYVEGEGERIDYDTRTEIAELFQKAWVKSGQDTVRGDYIWYDSISEKYMANATAPGETQGKPGRVRAILQPKAKDTDSAASQSGITLQPSTGLRRQP